MRDLLQMIFERQRLRGKEDHLDIPLEPDERVRLMGLERLLAGEAPAPGRRRFVRVRWRMDVQFTRPGGFGVGEVEDLSAGGLRVRCSGPPAPGTRLIVRLEDAARGVEYVFPGAVVWRGPRGRAAKVMGVRFDGVPNCGPSFGDETSDVWRRGTGLRAADTDESHVA